jgi:magnesium-transporting ATPase (P-type)
LFTAGLRTLCFAARTLSAEEATNFSREFHEASMSLTHRRDMLEKVAEQYERDLEFIGITAIEDRLQEVFFEFYFINCFDIPFLTSCFS